MFYALYNIIALFLLIPVCIYHLYRSVSRCRPAAFGERFGHIPKAGLGEIADRPVILVHAVSVGEAIAARPLLKALRQRYPRHALVVSNTTETGRSIASSFPEKDFCIYFPFDFLPAVRRTLDTLKPELVVIMETEIWPNFNREAHRRNIPLILANGRISDRSYNRYLRFSWFFRHSLQFFSSLCLQTETDRQRIIAIGAPPERSQTSGNLKYDIPYRQVPLEERNTLRQLFNIPQSLMVLTAGSTHPGEEELILSSYQELLKEHSDLFLVLVPRHPERTAAVAAILEKEGLAFRRRTELSTSSLPDDPIAEQFKPGEVLLVDTIGELMNLYALSDLVFVGGSLVATGGHNLLEPASLGIPCIFGPHMNNFREIAALIVSNNAGIQVEDLSGLTAACSSLIDNREQRQKLGLNGLKMMQENGGATQRHLEIIGQYL